MLTVVLLLLLLYVLYYRRRYHPRCVGCQAQGQRVRATTRAAHADLGQRYPFCADCATRYLV